MEVQLCRFCLGDEVDIVTTLFLSSALHKQISCYACGEIGHKSVECKKNKESLKCTKCKRAGHLAKICRSKADSGNTHRRSDKARTATTEKAEEDEDTNAIHEARTLRSDAGTPKLLL